MSTTKQISLMEMINRLSAGIEDDELFCQEEFEMVRNYCEQKSFMMSAADLSTIRRIGPVSYTHLDVYKRQMQAHSGLFLFLIPFPILLIEQSFTEEMEAK